MCDIAPVTIKLVGFFDFYRKAVKSDNESKFTIVNIVSALTFSTVTSAVVGLFLDFEKSSDILRKKCTIYTLN